MKNAMKKLLSFALALVLIASVFPMGAFAAEGDTFKVTLQLKLDESDKVQETMVLDSVMEGTEIDVVAIATRQWSEYTFSHYITKATGEKTEGKLAITADTIVDVVMMSAEEDKDEVVTPPAEDKTENDASGVNVLVIVYELKDQEAKEWASKEVKLTKNSATLSELAAAAGYTNYETITAKINGASFEGRAEVALSDGDQVDLIVTPGKANKPDKDEDKKPADKEEDKKPSDKEENNKPSKGEKVTLRVFHNDGTSDYTDIRCRTTDKLLDVIEDNEELSELARDGYKLIGWAFEANNDYNQEWIAAQHTVADDDDLRVYADWQETKPSKGDKDDDDKDEILMKIYLNGNTKSAVKVIDMSSYAKDGKITLAEAEKVVKKYYEAASNDDDMDVDGLFTAKTWDDGDYNMKDAKNSVSVNEKGDTIVYVMVRDAQKISSGTADSTNPKTGDTIFMAVTIMALSASALAAIYIFTKKRAAK